MKIRAVVLSDSSKYQKEKSLEGPSEFNGKERNEDLLFDSNSIFHFLYGWILGIISFFLLRTIIYALIFLIPIELGFHYMIPKYRRFYKEKGYWKVIWKKNPLMDLMLGYIGLILIYFIIFLFYF